MTAGNMPAGVNHDHKGRANCQRSNNAGCSRNDSAANRENEEESPDKFRNVFFHFSFVDW
jgi:hypothetical protein